MEFELKTLSPDGLEAAKKKATRYRLLSEPALAESICRDVLARDPDDREAAITLLLCLTDQFGARRGELVGEASAIANRFEDEYEKRYYLGVICERRGMAQLTRRGPGAGAVAYDCLREAMEHYEAAERLRPDAKDEAILRWNTCARVIMRHHDVRPLPDDSAPSMLE